MLKTVTPEQAGIRSERVCQFLESLVKRRLPLHSMLLMRGDSLFLEAYWKPFSAEKPHRMYSVTKSFVSVGIGLAQEDGLIDLDTPIVSYFPEKCAAPIDPQLQQLTVCQMLTMTTAGTASNWFAAAAKDRTLHYFNSRTSSKPSGTGWKYDSAGSQVLCALVEKVTGKKLLDYLKERLFDHMGAFENARMLQLGNGDSWGDSALICTSRDLCHFARFVMNYGVWNGKRLMNQQYLRAATSRQADNTLAGFGKLFYHGYGYQFWKTEKDGFAMIGMGGQMAICLPQQDLILVCTADVQGMDFPRDYIIAQFMDIIADNLEEPVDAAPCPRLQKLVDTLELFALEGQSNSPWAATVDGVEYVCLENPLGWNSFMVHFDSAGGTLCYEKASGRKQLPFFINKNRFCKFPEEGYSGQFGGQMTTDGSKYDAAVSCAWVQENKLLLYVQILDDYFGNLFLEISFTGDKALVVAKKSAENFMNDYNGEAVAIRRT